MAFNKDLLFMAPYVGRFPTDPQTRFWSYYSVTDSLATCAVAGYFVNSQLINLKIGDVVAIYDATNNAMGQYFVSSLPGGVVNLTSFGGSGGSGSTTTRVISSGTSDTATTADYLIAWNSATSGAKSQALPAGVSKGQTFVIKDEKGTAGTGNITITPNSGTIDNASTYVMNSNLQSVTLVWDGTSNYMVM